MDLQDFVSQALGDIVNGVKKAQGLTGPGIICPDGLETDDALKVGISTISAVEFQVSVRSDERTGSEAKLSVVAAIVGGHVKGGSGSNSGHVATLSFRVPVRFPRSKE
ncbi:MAG: hypothetical protein J0I24_16355 [Thiomonas arsenitoxydans]|jgi:hypothetical protein|uniref:Uncharacterized protein n=1 Tax=Thiomonas arsenitoxydans (strain DSM 22701 / CIP 110005 / 3As) TaxID=426114 RepID=A0A8I1MY74_THIA3|nr:hypothetical protein [Thiomonas arsenitoxydans]MBN8745841.1 hypothetical protein [Thiomonas arsenitoxydans]